MKYARVLQYAHRQYPVLRRRISSKWRTILTLDLWSAVQNVVTKQFCMCISEINCNAAEQDDWKHILKCKAMGKISDKEPTNFLMNIECKFVYKQLWSLLYNFRIFLKRIVAIFSSTFIKPKIGSFIVLCVLAFQARKCSYARPSNRYGLQSRQRFITQSPNIKYYCFYSGGCRLT